MSTTLSRSAKAKIKKNIKSQIDYATNADYSNREIGGLVNKYINDRLLKGDIPDTNEISDYVIREFEKHPTRYMNLPTHGETPFYATPKPPRGMFGKLAYWIGGKALKGERGQLAVKGYHFVKGHLPAAKYSDQLKNIEKNSLKVYQKYKGTLEKREEDLISKKEKIEAKDPENPYLSRIEKDLDKIEKNIDNITKVIYKIEDHEILENIATYGRMGTAHKAKRGITKLGKETKQRTKSLVEIINSGMASAILFWIAGAISVTYSTNTTITGAVILSSYSFSPNRLLFVAGCLCLIVGTAIFLHSKNKR
ncbi:MAG: hypothetical protein PHE43_00600 [Candidatus Nanoarchaeia archaeon]|nr:hypothetical protein [Candidatus Nanoarchaeia archaeon]